MIRSFGRRAARAMIVQSALLFCASQFADAQQTTLTSNTTPVTWSTATWSNGVPNSTTAQAIVPPISTGARTVNVSLPTTVNSLTLQNSGGGTITIAKTGTGAITFGGASAQIFDAVGTTTADDVISVPITLSSDLLITQNQTAAQLQISGGITGSTFALTTAGPGVIQLGGTNVYTGATTVTSGVLKLNSATALPGGDIAGSTTGSNLVMNGGAIALTNNAGTFTRDLGTGPGQVQFIGSGGFSSYGSGPHTVNLGGNSPTLVWGSTPGFLATGQTLILGAINSTAITEFQNPIDLGGVQQTITSVRGSGSWDGSLSGVISDGGIIKTGTGFLRFVGNTPNTYTGLTTCIGGNIQPGKTSGVTSIAGDILLSFDPVNNMRGILALQSSDQIADTSTVTLVGATGDTTKEGLMRMNGWNETVGALVSDIDNGAVEGNGTAGGSTGTFTIANNAPDFFGGQFRDVGAITTNSGKLAIVKSGSGVLTLAGTLPNTYTGSTTVNSGTLALQKSPGVAAVGGNLTIGDGVGGSQDIVLLAASEQISDTSAVTLNGTGADVGTLRLAGFNETIGSLRSTGGAGLVENSAATNSVLTLNGSSATASFSGLIQDGGVGTLALVRAGTGTAALSGINTYTGGTTITGGTLAITSDAAINNGVGGLTFGGGTLQLINYASSNLPVAAFNSVTNVSLGAATGTASSLSTPIAGSSALTFVGPGTLVLLGNNTYTGVTAVNGGTLGLGSAENVGVSGPLGVGGLITFAGGTLQYSAVNQFDYSSRFSTDVNQAISIDTNSQNVTFATSLVSSGGSLAKTGAGTLTLLGNNTYTGATSINGGTLNLGSAENPGVSGPLGNGGQISFGGGTLQYSAINQFDYSARFNPSGNQLISIDTNGHSVTFASAINSTGSTLTKLGAGTLTLQTNNSYSGNTTISGGVLLLGSANSAQNSTVSIGSANGLAFAPGIGSFNLGGLAGSASTPLADTGNAAVVLTVGSNNADTVYSGSLTDGGVGSSLIKTGSGKLTLAGANNYGGPTTINSGTVQFAQQASLYNGSPASWTATNLSVHSSATAAFNVGGPGEFTADNIQSIAALGTDSGGFASGSTLGLDTTNAAGGTFVYSSPIANPNAGVNTLGLTKFGAGTLKLSAANSYTGNTTVSGGTLLLGTAGAINTTAHVVLAGGTLATGGFAQTLSAPLQITTNSTLDLGGAGAVTFGNSNGTWAGLLTVSSWVAHSSHLYFGADKGGLGSSQLSQIKFADFAPGATITTTVAGGEVTPQIGDINQDGSVSAADISALLSALINVAGYQSQYFATAVNPISDVAFILDVNGDGVVNNADLQSEISVVAQRLTSGGGSIGVSSVPEPTTGALAGIGLFASSFVLRLRKRAASRGKVEIV